MYIKSDNEIFARHVPSIRAQKEEKTIDEFFQELLLLAE